jgi:hypothetical protein
MSCGKKENIQRASDMPAARLGDNLLMMSLERGQYFSLNAVGTRIWELLEKPTTDAALLNRLIAEYDVPEEVCAEQLAVFLTRLQERGLLAKGVV